jgi:tetratricopeptide (TPR) repeat protein
MLIKKAAIEFRNVRGCTNHGWGRAMRLRSWMVGLILLVATIGFETVAFATAMDRDYFTASLDSENARDLDLIDKAHTDAILYWLRIGRIDGAMNDLKFTLDRFPNHPRALLLTEAVAGVTGVPTLPLPYYERALKIYPQYALTHSQYGKYLAEIGKVDKGIEELQQAIKISPELAVAHAWLAEAYKKAGKAELSRKSVEQARSLGYTGNLFPNPKKGQE